MMKSIGSYLYRMISWIVVPILLQISPDLWVFFSGVVASLGANVFTTRALSEEARRSIGWMWLEFVVLLASSAFCFATGLVRRQVKERWKAGGGHPGHEEGFLRKEICKLTCYAVSAIVLLVTGLLIVLGG